MDNLNSTYMTQFIKLLYVIGVLSALLTFVSCSDDDKKTPVQETQLGALSGTWNIQSASQNGDRTDDFKSPNFVLTLSGTFEDGKPNGPYNYSITGNMPPLSPWASSGLWTFSDDAKHKIIRDDGVEITYVLDDDTLTLTFTCATCDDDNARINSAEGEWTFVLKKAQ